MEKHTQSYIFTPGKMASTVINKKSFIRVKKQLASVICAAERNLSEVNFKKQAISDEFKDKFSYISRKLSDNQLKQLVSHQKEQSCFPVAWNMQDQQDAQLLPIEE